jgi:hypothetical protein
MKEPKNEGYGCLFKRQIPPDDTELHQFWIDEALASGPTEEKSEAEWQALKRRVLRKRR